MVMSSCGGDITNGVVVMTFLDRRPVQLLKAVIKGLVPTI